MVEGFLMVVALVTIFCARARIANKWTAMIVILLHDEPLRFTDLHSRVEGITKKVLTDTLRALERDGMIVHVREPDAAAHYRLTSLGRSLHEPLVALQTWAQAHVDDVLAAQSRYDEDRDAGVLGVSGRRT